MSKSLSLAFFLVFTHTALQANDLCIKGFLERALERAPALPLVSSALATSVGIGAAGYIWTIQNELPQTFYAPAITVVTGILAVQSARFAWAIQHFLKIKSPPFTLPTLPLEDLNPPAGEESPTRDWEFEGLANHLSGDPAEEHGSSVRSNAHRSGIRPLLTLGVFAAMGTYAAHETFNQSTVRSGNAVFVSNDFDLLSLTAGKTEDEVASIKRRRKILGKINQFIDDKSSGDTKGSLQSFVSFFSSVNRTLHYGQAVNIAEDLERLLKDTDTPKESFLS